MVYVRSQCKKRLKWRTPASNQTLPPNGVVRRLCMEIERQAVSCAAFARKMGVTPAYMTNVLRGSKHLSLETLDVFASELGRDLNFFLSPDTLNCATTARSTSRLHAAEGGAAYETVAAVSVHATQLSLFARQACPEILRPYSISRSRARPFLKWAGGKSSLLRELVRRKPASYNCYFEPFLGGGALFFELAPPSAILSDANAELIQCYRVVRDQLPALLSVLSKASVTEQEFYRNRALDPDLLDPVSRAARFIYLNKTCFNGLYRVNKRGQFNTPFGKRTDVRTCDEVTLARASKALHGVELVAGDFMNVLLTAAAKGDFVYLDPPYLPVSTYSDFKRYTPDQFRAEDHERLAKVYGSLHERGCKLLLSNSYHPRVEQLYSKFKVYTVEAPRFINCQASGRGKVKELIVTNYDTQA